MSAIDVTFNSLWKSIPQLHGHFLVKFVLFETYFFLPYRSYIICCEITSLVILTHSHFILIYITNLYVQNSLFFAHFMPEYFSFILYNSVLFVLWLENLQILLAFSKNWALQFISKLIFYECDILFTLPCLWSKLEFN